MIVLDKLLVEKIWGEGADVSVCCFLDEACLVDGLFVRFEDAAHEFVFFVLAAQLAL